MKNIPVYPLVLVLLVLLLGACKTTDSGLSQSGPSQGQDADITLSAGEEKLFQMAFYDGLKAKTLENLSEARQAFEKALEINPNSGATRYELARIFIAENQY